MARPKRPKKAKRGSVLRAKGIKKVRQNTVIKGS